MIRIVARGVASVLLEVATLLVFVVIAFLLLSALITARFVGVNPVINRRATLGMRVTRDLIAFATQAKRQELDGD